MIRKESGHTAPDASGCGLMENEEGFVLALSMMVLVVLTLLGISANRSSVTELQIAGNENLAKMLFYQAEAAAHEAGQLLENIPGDEAPAKLKSKRPTALSWLSPKTDYDELSERDTETWEKKSNASQIAPLLDATVEMAALDFDMVTGDDASSIKMGTVGNLYSFKLFGKAGYTDPKTGREISKMIEIGYRKRY